MVIGQVNHALHTTNESAKTSFSEHRNVYSLNAVGNIKIGDTIIHPKNGKLGMYGIFIDSGSTFTYFPRENYLIFRNKIVQTCNSNK